MEKIVEPGPGGTMVHSLYNKHNVHEMCLNYYK